MSDEFNNNSNNMEQREFRQPAPQYTPDSQPAAAGSAGKSRRKHPALRFAALAMAFLLACGGSAFGGAAMYARYAADTAAPVSQDAAGDSGLQAADPGTIPADFLANTVEDDDEDGTTPAGALYKAQLPSCVGITVEATLNYFGRATTSAVSGSGFILTQDGYIATNYHVIEDAAESSSAAIQVFLADGTLYDAVFVAGDENRDIAVLKIDATGLQPVSLGSSADLEVGDTVYTIGNPLGELTFSLADGLVSALGREIDTGSGPMDMLQTNCAINPGNSGGPLFDARGNVVGIVTAKYTESSSGVSAEGLGFAIPIDDVQEMLSDILQYGYITGRPYLGIGASSVSTALRRYYSLPAGVLVESVDSGSCAETAGLQQGDIITAADGTSLTSSDALRSLLASSYRAGDTMVLDVYRNGQRLSLTVTLDEKTSQSTVSQQPVQQEPTPAPDNSRVWGNTRDV